MSNNILLLGSGGRLEILNSDNSLLILTNCKIFNLGREHAIAWKLQQSEKTAKIHVFPGSHGIGQLEKVNIVSGLDLKDFQVISYQSRLFPHILRPPSIKNNRTDLSYVHHDYHSVIC
jgi:hypothetical protein